MKVTADGFTPLNTHIFDRESDYLESDTVFGVKGSLIADFTPGPDGVLVCETDIVLALNLDGEGRSRVATGIGFLDHMLAALATHARFDLDARCRGDRTV